MGMAAENPMHADHAAVNGAALRTRDQLFCLELANQATDVYFDRTWENGTHEMSWCEARWFVKCAWTDCLNRGAAGYPAFGASAATL